MRLFIAASIIGLFVLPAIANAQATGIVGSVGQSSTAIPSGAAGGDLGGTYPNPTVTGGSHITNSSILNSGLATPAPCSAFGTTSGTCLQGGAGNVPNNSLVTPPTAVGTAAVGQIPGTTTNDSASPGNVGEILDSIGQDLSNGTVTFTNSSAVIGDTAACAAGATTNCVGIGSVMNLTTTGGLPTNFATATAYYVSETGFTPGVSYELAATPTGTPIVAGSAGTGTQTRVSNIVTSNTNPFTVAARLLTAGQWSCGGSTKHLFSSATTTLLSSWIGTTNNNVTGAVNESFTQIDDIRTTTTFADKFHNGPIQLQLAAPTEYYLIVEDSFSAGSEVASGSLLCTRMR